MSETRDVAHTPGPWELEDSAKITDAGRKSGLIAVVVRGAHVCEIFPFGARRGGSDRDLTEHRANARLIAAAPELLAAALKLEEAEEHYHNQCDECEGEGVPEACGKCFPLFDDARTMRWAAIRKATGREP